METDLLGGDDNFNCTIQELKQGKLEYLVKESPNFNCTIQELKQLCSP